jgi:hypothetical protein
VLKKSAGEPAGQLNQSVVIEVNAVQHHYSEGQPPSWLCEERRPITALSARAFDDLEASIDDTTLISMTPGAFHDHCNGLLPHFVGIGLDRS